MGSVPPSRRCSLLKDSLQKLTWFFSVQNLKTVLKARTYQRSIKLVVMRHYEVQILQRLTYRNPKLEPVPYIHLADVRLLKDSLKKLTWFCFLRPKCEDCSESTKVLKKRQARRNAALSDANFVDVNV